MADKIRASLLSSTGLSKALPPHFYSETGSISSMSGETNDHSGDFNEPFTLITSTAKTLGVAAANKMKARSFMGHVTAGKEWIANKHAGVQPWADFLNVRKFSRPSSAGEVTSRLFGNIQRFQSNYLFVFLGLLVYCIITNPTLLFALAFCAGAWWFISIKNQSENIKIMGRDTSAKELYFGVTLISIPLFYFAGAGSAVFWIIGASIVVILVHAAALSLPRQTVDEELGIVMEDVTVS